MTVQQGEGGQHEQREAEQGAGDREAERAEHDLEPHAGHGEPREHHDGVGQVGAERTSQGAEHDARDHGEQDGDHVVDGNGGPGRAR